MGLFALLLFFRLRKMLQNLCCLLQNHESCYFSIVFLSSLWMFLSNFATTKIKL